MLLVNSGDSCSGTNLPTLPRSCTAEAFFKRGQIRWDSAFHLRSNVSHEPLCGCDPPWCVNQRIKQIKKAAALMWLPSASTLWAKFRISFSHTHSRTRVAQWSTFAPSRPGWLSAWYLFTTRGVSLRLPLSRTVGLNKTDDWRSGQGLCGKDTPLQLDPETCERIPPQDDLARFHVKNLPARAHGAGCQRHWGGTEGGGGWVGRRGCTSERDISREVAEKERKRRRRWGKYVEVGREKGQCGLGDVTGNGMSHVPPSTSPPPNIPPPCLNSQFLRQRCVTSVTTHKSVHTARGRNAREKWLKWAHFKGHVTCYKTKCSVWDVSCLYFCGG